VKDIKKLPKIFGKVPHKRIMQEYCVYMVICSYVIWDENRRIEGANNNKPNGKGKVVDCYKGEWPKKDHSCSHTSTHHRPKHPS